MSRNLYQSKSINYNKFTRNVTVDGNLTVNGDTTIEGKLSVAVESGNLLSNAISGAIIDAPIPTSSWYPVRLDFTNNTILRLPSLADVPFGYEYLFYRPITSGSSTLNAIIPQTGETINGKQFDGNNNGAIFLTSLGGVSGTSVRILRTENTWSSIDEFSSPSFENLNVDTVIGPWSGSKLIIINGGGLTITLPPLSNTIGTTVPRGSTTKILSLGVNTVAATGTNRFYGSVNGVTLNNAASFNMLANESCILMVLNNVIWIVH